MQHDDMAVGMSVTEQEEALAPMRGVIFSQLLKKKF